MTDAAPPTSTWVVAVHARADPNRPLGTGVVIDDNRVLTCTHVLGQRAAEDLGVAFPRADDPYQPLTQVRDVRTAVDPRADVAVLELSEPLPAGIEPARLRRPKGAELVQKHWWAYGFADQLGNDAHGTVGADLTFGWARLDTKSRYLVEKGFSGGGLWSPDYDAVVGLVGQARDNGDGRVFTLHAAVTALREEKLDQLTDRFDITAAGEDAVASWGWALTSDDEATRHWVPRSRGVTIDTERGYRFSGRSVALTEIVTWLQRPQLDRKVLVVTGSPGVGKSAVLARIVTTADPVIVDKIPATDTAVRAPLGSIACAVHAKGKTALQVGHEIARAASAPLPDQVADVVPGIRDVLIEHGNRRFTVVVDALDEAVTATDARLIIRQLLVPLAETCSDVGAQVLVGTRRRDDTGDLINEFGRAHRDLDLDLPDYFALDDLVTYAEATLQLVGDERPGNPYTDPEEARPLAKRIAEVAEPNFLITGLIARTHGLHDDEPAHPTTITIEPTVSSALNDYLARIPDIGAVTAADALLPLAFAYAPGLTTALWATAIRALTGRTVKPEALHTFARGSAANFLVETTTAGTTYRLFHQALNDSLLTRRAERHDPASDQRALTRALIRYGRAGGWAKAPDYLLTALPHHAAQADMVVDLLGDTDYLLYANLRRLIPVANTVSTAEGLARARLIRLTPNAINASPADRASLFSVTEALDNLGNTYRHHPIRSTYRAVWAHSETRAEFVAFDGHADRVLDVCAVQADGLELLASATADGMVRVWDASIGELLLKWNAHAGGTNKMCTVQVDGKQSLASAGADGTVRVWDPRAGEAQRTYPITKVLALCMVQVNGKQLLASAGVDGMVQVWDPDTNEPPRTCQAHTGRVNAVCAVTLAGQRLLASSGNDGTIRVWDPATTELRLTMPGNLGGVAALCAVRVDGRHLLASGRNDGTVQVWDPQNGQLLGTFRGRVGINALCAVSVDGRQLLASGRNDGTVQVWDPQNGQLLQDLHGHSSPVNALCAVSAHGRQLLTSAGDDRTVLMWDLGESPEAEPKRFNEGFRGAQAVCTVTVDGSQLVASAGGRMVRLFDACTGDAKRNLKTHHRIFSANAVCAVSVDGRQRLAVAGLGRSGNHRGIVQLWDPGDGMALRVLQGPIRDAQEAVCAVKANGRELLASGGYDGIVRVWDPRDGKPLRAMDGSTLGVNALCTMSVDGRQLLAAACAGGTVEVWDPATGDRVHTLECHTADVRDICAITVDGRQLLASAGSDGMIRIWNPSTGIAVHAMEAHTEAVNAVCALTVDGRELLTSAGRDKRLRVWEPTTGRCLATVSLPRSPSATAPGPTGVLVVVGLRLLLAVKISV